MASCAAGNVPSRCKLLRTVAWPWFGMACTRSPKSPTASPTALIARVLCCKLTKIASITSFIEFRGSQGPPTPALRFMSGSGSPPGAPSWLRSSVVVNRANFPSISSHSLFTLPDPAPFFGPGALIFQNQPLFLVPVNLDVDVKMWYSQLTNLLCRGQSRQRTSSTENVEVP